MSIGKVVVTVCCIAILVVSVTRFVQRGAEYEEACHSAGGVPFMPREGKICLHPDAVIKLK